MENFQSRHWLIPGLQGLLLRPVGKDDVLRAAVNTLLQYISERLGATELTFVGDKESRRQGTRFNSCLVLWKASLRSCGHHNLSSAYLSPHHFKSTVVGYKLHQGRDLAQEWDLAYSWRSTKPNISVNAGPME